MEKRRERNGVDLFKVGVFMGGLALMIIALLGISFTVFSLMAFNSYQQESFYSHCYEKVITVSPRADLENVEVFDTEGNIVCEIESIRAGSEDLCTVDEEGHYKVVSGEKKKVVECYKQTYPATID